MNERQHLGIALVAATLLLFSAGYLAQCTSAGRRSEPQMAAPVATSTASVREGDRGRTGQSMRELAEEEEKEERAKIQGVAHALRTIGANPELRRTYGIRP